ncbi:MAG: glyoxylate/hydroxypyruvate reductase A [Ilumatobacter sp.]|nr:glyoxylate/hydroxypyruvate reductase A [Ilumatobacter sp.]
MTVLVDTRLGSSAWAAELRAALPDTEIATADDGVDPAAVEYLVVWHPPQDFTPYTRLRAILLIGAGFDHLDLDALPDVPVVRLVDPAMAADIALYVLSWVVHFQRDFDRFAAARHTATWDSDLPARFPRDHVVGVLGAGAIGQVVLDTCAAHGFVTLGWSRSSHDRPLHQFLRDVDVVVDLVPLSPNTVGLLGADEFAALGDGVVINVGRGPTVDTAALLDALDGELRAAVLDVFEVEPLPADSPLWSRPDVIVTPHIAGRSDPVTGAPIIATQIEELRAGGMPADVIRRR